jgi:hypothetical protein
VKTNNIEFAELWRLVVSRIGERTKVVASRGNGVQAPEPAGEEASAVV